jgi:hypothetical protein
MGTKEATLVTGPARSTSRLGKTEGLDFMAGYKERINVSSGIVLQIVLYFARSVIPRSNFDFTVMDEKKTPNEVAVTSATPDIADGEIETQGYSEVSTKTLLRKLDWHIIPFMSLIYLYDSINSLLYTMEHTLHTPRIL